MCDHSIKGQQFGLVVSQADVVMILTSSNIPDQFCLQDTVSNQKID